MKKIIILVFALGLVPALIHAAENCGCVAGDLACANNCAISKVNNVNKNIKADQQKAANTVKAQKDQAKKDAKAKKDQLKKEAKAKKDAAKKEAKAKKDAAKKKPKPKKMKPRLKRIN